MKDSTKRRSVVGRTLMLIGAMFAAGAADKKTFRGTHSGTSAHGNLGWGGSAVYSPTRSKHKGFMRDPEYRAKRK